MPNTKLSCPKCNNKNTKIETDHTGTVLYCWCGLRKVLKTNFLNEQEDFIKKEELGDLLIRKHKYTKSNTLLYETLAELAKLKVATTGAISKNLSENSTNEKFIKSNRKNSEIASVLTTLRYKGLVEVIEYKRGTLGGSTWTTTHRAIEFLNGNNC